jgi:hypothetical protein
MTRRTAANRLTSPPSGVVVQFPPERMFRPVGQFADLDRSAFAEGSAETLLRRAEGQLRVLRHHAGHKRHTPQHEASAERMAETLVLLALELSTRAKQRRFVGALHRDTGAQS